MNSVICVLFTLCLTMVMGMYTTESPRSNEDYDESRRDIVYSFCQDTVNLYSNGAIDAWLDYFADDGFEYCFTNNTGMDLIDGRYENICWHNRDEVEEVMFERIAYIKSTNQQQPLHVEHSCDIIQTGQDEFTSITVLTSIGELCEFIGIMENHHVFNQDDKFTSLNITREKDIIKCYEINTTEADTSREEILHSLCQATQNLYSNGTMDEWLEYFADDGFEYCFTNDTGMDLIDGRVENICWRNKDDLADVMYDRIDYIDSTDQEEAIEVQNTCHVTKIGDDEYTSITTLTTIGQSCTFTGIMENHHVFDQDDKLTTLNVTRQRDIVNCVDMPTIISTTEAPIKECEYSAVNRLMNRLQCGKGFRCNQEGNCEAISVLIDDMDDCF